MLEDVPEAIQVSPFLSGMFLGAGALLVILFLMAWAVTLCQGWRDKRRESTPEGVMEKVVPILKRSVEDLRTEQNRLDNLRADARRDLTKTMEELHREDEEWLYRDLPAKLGIKVVDKEGNELRA